MASLKIPEQHGNMAAHSHRQLTDFQGDASLGALREALARHPARPLHITYGGRTIRPGYHLTEVKAGSFVTLDCGGNPDSWHETVLQVEDLGPDDATDFMQAGKFSAILDAVARHVTLDATSRVTVEIGTPGEPMQVFDVGTLNEVGAFVQLALVPRPAICKPRHRAEVQGMETQDVMSKSACCSPAPAKAACC